MNGPIIQKIYNRCIHLKLKVYLFLQRIFWKIALQFSKVLLRNDHGILYTYQNMKRWGHKRVYHTHSDVIFVWVLWIWLSSWDFFLSILIFSESLGRQNLNIRLGPSGSAPASAPRFALRSATRAKPNV